MLCSTPDAFEAASARLTTLRLVAKIAPTMGFDAGQLAATLPQELGATIAQVMFLAWRAQAGSAGHPRARFATGDGFLSVGAGIDFIAGAHRHWSGGGRWNGCGARPRPKTAGTAPCEMRSDPAGRSV